MMSKLDIRTIRREPYVQIPLRCRLHSPEPIIPMAIGIVAAMIFMFATIHRYATFGEFVIKGVFIALVGFIVGHRLCSHSDQWYGETGIHGGLFFVCRRCGNVREGDWRWPNYEHHIGYVNPEEFK